MVCRRYTYAPQVFPLASPHGSQALPAKIPEGRQGGQHHRGPEDRAIAEMPKVRLGSDGLNAWGGRRVVK